MNAVLFAEVAALAGVLATAWLLAVRAGPDWLRPAHGPLWYAASALTVLIGAAAAGLQQHDLIAANRLIRFTGTFNALLLALILLVVLFPLMVAAFKALYRPGPQEPPCPPLFIWFGIAPDGSPLVGLRWMLRALVAVSLVAGALLVLGMDLTSVPGKGQPQHTLWAFAYAALLGVLFGSTHPVRPMPELRRAKTAEAVQPTADFSKRIEALHRWLGAPPAVETLPAIGRDRRGSKAPETRFGLELYPFQTRMLGDWQQVPALALAGPVGSGRTTAGLLRAVDLALTTGASCVVVTAQREAVPRLQAQLQALTAQIAAGAAVVIDDGLPPRPADIWLVALDDLERFLDTTAEPATHPLIQRLHLVVVDDVDQLFGPAVARARFVLYRLAALRGAHPPQVLLIGNLAKHVLQQIADRIATQQVQIVATAGEHDTQGALSRPVTRLVVDPGKILHHETATVGLLGIRDGFARVVTEVDGPHERLIAELFGDPWQPWPPPEDAVSGSPEVLLARVGPRSAWQVLGQRRYYAGSGEPAREYLLFADDPMSQLLQRQFGQRQTWWPTWYDTTRFPRILSAVPAGASTSQGLQVQARAHIRAALDKGYCDTKRLEQVFSPELAGQVLQALSGSASFSSVDGWRPDPADSKKPLHAKLCRAQGAVESDRERQRQWGELRAPAVGKTWQVPLSLLPFQYFVGAVVSLDGTRYKVVDDPQAGPGARHRLLTEEPAYLIGTPVRQVKFSRHGAAALDVRNPRFSGAQAVETVRCTVQLGLTQLGVRHFSRTSEQNPGQTAAADRLSRPFESLHPPVQSPGFATRAWAVRLPGADEVVLHTLSHVMRDAMDWFFLGASDFLGVGYELAFEGKPSVVFYDRHPEGLGCLDDIDDAKDLLAILSAARAILDGCNCETSCAKCCQSIGCTQTPHNQNLDRHKTVAVLNAVLGRGAAG